jgi:hypothetical protein
VRVAPREKASLAGFVLADFRPGDSLMPTTPLQQVARHVAQQLGVARLDTRRLVLSTVDAVEVERRTREMCSRFAPAEACEVLMAQWTKAFARGRTSPAVSLRLAAGEVEYLPEEV